MSDCNAGGPRKNFTVGSCVHMVNTAAIESIEHGLHALTAVPRSIQPSVILRMLK